MSQPHRLERWKTYGTLFFIFVAAPIALGPLIGGILALCTIPVAVLFFGLSLFDRNCPKAEGGESKPNPD